MPKFVWFILFIICIPFIEMPSQAEYHSTFICVDRPITDRASPPDEVWVDVVAYYHDYGSLEPFSQAYSFDEYISGVLVGELGQSPLPHLPANGNDTWEDITLEAMAVAIRTFTWFRLNYAAQLLDRALLPVVNWQPTRKFDPVLVSIPS